VALDQSISELDGIHHLKQLAKNGVGSAHLAV
jgi:hypothetical protein